jgi:hypothetical protein
MNIYFDIINEMNNENKIQTNKNLKLQNYTYV